MASTDSDMLKSVPSTSLAGSSSSSPHRSCQSYTRRMSNLLYHSLRPFCIVCRGVECSVNVICDECNYWSVGCIVS